MTLTWGETTCFRVICEPTNFAGIGQFRIVQQQKNRVEVQGNNLHFPLFWTIQNANYSPEPRLCSFVAAQFETSLLELVNYTRCKTCLFDVLPGGALRTNLGDSGLGLGLGEPRIYNYEQESWDKYELSAFFRTHPTWIRPHLPNLALHPPYNVETTCIFFWFATLNWVRKGEVRRF